MSIITSLYSSKYIEMAITACSDSQLPSFNVTDILGVNLPTTTENIAEIINRGKVDHCLPLPTDWAGSLLSSPMRLNLSSPRWKPFFCAATQCKPCSAVNSAATKSLQWLGFNTDLGCCQCGACTFALWQCGFIIICSTSHKCVPLYQECSARISGPAEHQLKYTCILLALILIYSSQQAGRAAKWVFLQMCRIRSDDVILSWLLS